MRGLRDRVGWPERAALALLLAWVAWSLTATLIAGRIPSDAFPYVLAPIVLAAGVAAGGPLARHAASMRLPAWLFAGAVVLIAGVLLTTAPGKEPLGYANANAALAVQLVAMCGLGLLASAQRTQRLVLSGALALAVASIVLNQSSGGLVVVIPLALAIGLMVWRPARHCWWAVLLGAATLAAGVCTILLLAGRVAWPPWAERAFDPVRRHLWEDAASLWLAHPLAGAGPGSFSEATPLSVDPDTSAAHSSILQIGSETGVVGATFFALAALTGLLWAARGRAAYAVVGAAAWTALLLHSLIDHLLEFAPVVFAAGLVLGWAAASGGSVSSATAAEGARSEQLDVPEGERPPLG